MVRTDAAMCSEGWPVGQRFHSKFNWASKLTKDLWMDTFNVPQCCEKHKVIFIPEIYKYYVASQVAIALPDWYSSNSSEDLSEKTADMNLKKLAAEGWFDRAWVAQEIALSRIVVINDINGNYRDATYALLKWQLQLAQEVDGAQLLKIRRCAYSYRNLRSFPIGLNPVNDPLVLMFNKRCYYPEDLVYSLANLCRLKMNVYYKSVYDTQRLWSSTCAMNPSEKAPWFKPLMTACWVDDTYGRSVLPRIGFEDRVIWPEASRHEVLHWCRDMSIVISGIVRKVRLPVKWTAIEMSIIGENRWEMTSITAGTARNGEDWRSVASNLKAPLRELGVSEDEISSTNLLRWVIELWATSASKQSELNTSRLIIRLRKGEWFALCGNDSTLNNFFEAENSGLSRSPRLVELILCQEQDDTSETVESAIVDLSENLERGHHAGHVWYSMDLQKPTASPVDPMRLILA